MMKRSIFIPSLCFKTFFFLSVILVAFIVSTSFKFAERKKEHDLILIGRWRGYEENHEKEGVYKEWVILRNADG